MKKLTWKELGSTDRERRDRGIGLILTLVGLVALTQVPEARLIASYMDSNAFGAVFVYRFWFALSLLIVIGPAIMLPHRAGAVPLALACLFCFTQLQAEFDPQSRERAATEASAPASAKRAIGG